MVLPQTNQALLTTGERKCEVRDIGVPRMVDPNTGMPYNNGVIIKVQTSTCARCARVNQGLTELSACVCG